MFEKEISKNNIDCMLETKRRLMIENGLKEGLHSSKVLNLSKEVDELVYISMLKLNYSSRFR